jgi:hypothetical protein
LSAPSYGQLEVLLRRRGFTRLKSGLHNLWVNIDADGSARRVIVCNKPLRPMPAEVLSHIATQMGITPDQLRRHLFT